MIVRLVNLPDVDEMRSYAVRNAEHLRPWTPTPPLNYLDLEFQQVRMVEHLRRRDAGLEYRFGAFDGTTLTALVTLGSIERAAFQNGRLGYSVDVGYQGKGIATLAVSEVCRFAFEELKLHRIEANVMPSNLASKGVLQKCDFIRIGFSHQMVKIAGNWEDHEMFMKLKG